MNTKRPREHYQVVITSGTDARKKPVSFSLSKKTVVVFIAVFFLVIAICLVISSTAFLKISESQTQIEVLTKKIENQSDLLEEYAAQINVLKKSMQEGGGMPVSYPVSKSSPPAGSRYSGIAQDPAASVQTETAPAEPSAEEAGRSSEQAAPQTKITAAVSAHAPPRSEMENQQSLLGFLSGAGVFGEESLNSLAWPFQDPAGGYDTDWPGPEGYYHAPRGNGQLHEGVDICAAYETPILAVTDGAVVSNGWNNDGGWMVEIRSPEGCIFRYLHMASQSSLSAGTSVQAGATVVGYCGNTGGDYPNHLHLSIYLPDSSETIDPTPYLKAAEERFVSGE